MLREIIIAIEAFGKAHQFIRQHRLWRWIWLPGLLYMALFLVSMYFFAGTARQVVDYLVTATGLQAWVSRIDSGLVSFLVSFTGIVLWLLMLLFYFSLFKYVWLILGSPIFAWLSEKTASLLEGRDFPFSLAQLLRDIWRGIRLALRNTLWQSVYMVAILFLTLIPLVGWAAPVLALFVECYYYGFSMLDYSCERRKLGYGDSIRFVGQHKGLAIGNGMLFYLMHLVPVLGWMLAPAYAVIAATISIHDLERKGLTT